MPSKAANVKNEKQCEALKGKGMSKQRAAKIAKSPDASRQGTRRAAPARQLTGRDVCSEEEGRPQGRQAAAKTG